MSIEFPFVKVPPELRIIVGEPTPGTRTYRREGTYDECGEWFEAVAKHFDGVGLSPGGVSMFVPVSRAAVHQRLRLGKLTAFTFHVTHDEKSLFGTKRKAKERPYILLSVPECKAWAEELKRRTGHTDEPNESQAREADDFVEKDPKDRGNKRVVYKEPMSRAETIALVKCMVASAVENALEKLLPEAIRQSARKGTKKP